MSRPSPTSLRQRPCWGTVQQEEHCCKTVSHGQPWEEQWGARPHLSETAALLLSCGGRAGGGGGRGTLVGREAGLADKGAHVLGVLRRRRPRRGTPCCFALCHDGVCGHLLRRGGAGLQPGEGLHRKSCQALTCRCSIGKS